MRRIISAACIVVFLAAGCGIVQSAGKDYGDTSSDIAEVIAFFDDNQQELTEIIEYYREHKDTFKALIAKLEGLPDQYEIIEIDINKRYLYNEMVEDIEKLARAYPSLVKTEIVGESEDGRDIHLIKLGKGEHKSLILGGVHACEIAATPLLMKMVNEYARHYYTAEQMNGFDIKGLLDNTTLHIVPLVNPDGMEIAVGSEKGLQTPEIVQAFQSIPGTPLQWKANANGVDLNRNFTCANWGKVLPGRQRSDLINHGPHAQYYKGSQPASEKETQAIEKIMTANDYKILFDIHSKGRVIYYYKAIQTQEFNDITYRIAKKVGEASGYQVLPKTMSTYGEGTDGNTTDFAAERGIHSLTIETMLFHIPYPYPIDLIMEEWNHVKDVGLVLAQETLNLAYE